MREGETQRSSPRDKIMIPRIIYTSLSQEQLIWRHTEPGDVRIEYPLKR